MKTGIRPFVSLIIICSLLIPSILPVFASSPEESDVNKTPTQTMVGTLTSDTGEQIQIFGKKVGSYQRSVDNQTVDTYEFVIPNSIMRDSGITQWGPDGGYASTVYLSIYYTGAQEYLLTRVSGYWEISDPRATVEAAFLHYGCTEYTGPARYQYVHDLPVNNYFSCETGFTHYIDYIGGILGSYLVLNYLIGTSRRWTFTLNNYLFNNSVM